jgi:hypothetical protein
VQVLNSKISLIREKTILGFGISPVQGRIQLISTGDSGHVFPKAPYPRKQYFPGSLTRNLYKKKIPEIMKMVDMVP